MSTNCILSLPILGRMCSKSDEKRMQVDHKCGAIANDLVNRNIQLIDTLIVDSKGIHAHRGFLSW